MGPLYILLLAAIAFLVVLSGCTNNRLLGQPTLVLANGTVITQNSSLEISNPVNQTLVLEYSNDNAQWKQLYKNQHIGGTTTINIDTNGIEDGEYFLRLFGSTANSSGTKTVIISNPPKFDLEYNLTMENKTLFLEARTEDVSGKIASGSWSISGNLSTKETVKIPYSGQNLTISFLGKNKYGLEHSSSITVNSSVLDSMEYCLVKDFVLKTEGFAAYEYKKVTFDFEKIKTVVSPIERSVPVLGQVVQTGGVGNIALGYGVELVGSYYGNLSRCSSGQFVKGTRTFHDYGNRIGWYDNNYPKKPSSGAGCSQQGSAYCDDDYSIHATEKSPVIEADNRTIHWYDVPNIMMPMSFLPTTINQTFISFIKGDNGYCWIKWVLEGEYDSGLVEKIPLAAIQVDRSCFVDNLPILLE
ncbi:MAG TPA: hypothetical protein VJA47_05970 [archaeon]|nr:hypothetical protein [archaeon]